MDAPLTVVDLGRGERLARHRILVRPQRFEVSEFCTGLTGLTPDEVDRGVGDNDRKQFARQCGASGYPFGDRHTTAKAVFAETHGPRRRPGMARALQIAGLPLEGRHHRGDDDAWNIAALVPHLAGRAAWPA